MNNTFSGTIQDIAVGIYDGPHATPPESGDGPIFLGIENLTAEGRVDFSKVRHISEQHFPEWTRRVVPKPGDIVFSYEATLHRYGIIPEGFRGCLGRRLALIRPDTSKVDNQFLFYYLLSPKWRGVVESNIITGATVDRVPLKNFPCFPVQIPSLDTQKRIANVLSSYDSLIENNRRRIELLGQAARLLYKEWFVHFRFPGHEHVRIVDGVPEGWKNGSAVDAMDILSGGTPKTTQADYWSGEIPFFTPKDSTESLYVIATEKTITVKGLQSCNSKLYPKDTVFITARGTVGKVNLAQVPMAMNQSCYALVAKVPMNQYYLYFALVEGVHKFESQASGAVFDAIVRDTFKRIPFLVPNPALIDQFTFLVEPVIKQVENLTLQNQKLKVARDLLLPRLMNGEIAI